MGVGCDSRVGQLENRKGTTIAFNVVDGIPCMQLGRCLNNYFNNHWCLYSGSTGRNIGIGGTLLVSGKANSTSASGIVSPGPAFAGEVWKVGVKVGV